MPPELLEFLLYRKLVKRKPVENVIRQTQILRQTALLGPNHTQYKISLTFLYKMTFERELRQHLLSYVTFSYRSPSNCTTMQDAYKCRVPQPSNAAVENKKLTKRVHRHLSECHTRSTLHFMKVVLTTFMTPYENVVLYWAWFDPYRWFHDRDRSSDNF